tara:strand:- start:635 stop:1585 length:951 start_codon:yes stop_codon:yes gene_type:complete
MASTKLERQLKLLAELLNAESPRTAQELRNKVGMYPDDLAAFRKRFSEDKKELKNMGVPITVLSVGDSTKDTESYYVENADYYLPDLDLTEQELAALNYAANSVHLLKDMTDEEALRKLGGYQEGLGTETLASEKSHLRVSTEQVVPTLFEALTKKSRIEFIYRDKPRVLEPYVLQFAGEKWYLTGNVLEDNATKSFRADRMSGIKVSPFTQEFSVPDEVKGANLLSFTYGDDEPVTALLRIDSSYIPWVEQNLDVDVDLEPDGSGLAKFVVLNYDIFIDRVLLLLDHAEILEPPILRQQLVKHLQMLQATWETHK